MNLVFVMVGGFLGAISRFALGEFIHFENGFPFATLLVNLLGCFLLAWFFTFILYKKANLQKISPLIGTGFLGSFTTFSTFSVETIRLFENHLVLYGLIYCFLSIAGGILFAFFGWELALIGKKEGETR